MFCRSKVIGKVMVYRYSMDRDIHAYLIVKIVSVFKGWMNIVKTRLGLSAIWWRRALSVDRTIKRGFDLVAWLRQGFRFRCGAHLVNLALGSSEIVLRSKGTNFVLERSRFDEVWVLKLALDAAPDALWVRLVRSLAVKSAWVPRVRHRTLAPDAPGSVRS